MKHIVLGISGATGAIYSYKLLSYMKQRADVRTHLVVSDSAWLMMKHEMPHIKKQDWIDLADEFYGIKEVGSRLASGAFETAGMIVAPCSMRSLAAMAHGLSDNLLTRCADVHLKERRPLLIMPRETPLNLAHLHNMTLLTQMGAILYPPFPAFYHHPQSIDDIVDEGVYRLLYRLGIDIPERQTWEGV